MPFAFRTDHQKKLFGAVLTGVEALGYRGGLCARDYEFSDWLGSGERVKVPVAAFARQPADYDSACLVVFPESDSGSPRRYRSLGAPFGIEVRDDCIVPWSIGLDDKNTRPIGNPIPTGGVTTFFTSVERKWRPQEVVRAKNIGRSTGTSELDWVDTGLIPALESEISRKLDAMLTRALAAGHRVFHLAEHRPPDAEELYRLVFRLLAGKVLHDRKVGIFRQLDANTYPREVLRAVCEYYEEPNNYLSNRDAQEAVAAEIWTGLTFQNLSVDALAFVYENTLVDDTMRRDNSIHSTPHRVARYMVERLPFTSIAEGESIVVEPCSGHGVFLVAALKRLRDLLDPSWDARRRHRFFASRLLGFERDGFAREVCRLCLTLADFPNPNGWALPPTDVFTSRKLPEALKKAGVVLCNPPFEEFSRAERERYGVDIGTSKPLEVLRRVLRHAPQNVNLGFVLPRTMVDGTSYRDVRGELARRFGQVEITALPDKVFRHADVESVLLLATGMGREKVTVHFREVKKPTLPAFYDTGAVTRADAGEFSVFDAESKTGFHVPALLDVWQHLEHLPKLSSLVEIHRGVEWKPPFDERKYLSALPKPGFLRGLRNVEEGFDSFAPPKPCWLNAKPEFRRRNAWDYPWSQPKVIVNAATKARGAWRLAAAPDITGLVCTQSYQCLWPVGSWTVKCLAALINSPVVSAFAASREGKRHVRTRTLNACPIPNLAQSEMVMLEGLVDAYMAVMNEGAEQRFELWGGGSWEERARRILLEMDALILSGYNLPPWLERRLLDFFKGEARPVPFAFGDYYPPDFAPNLPLRVLISRGFQASTAPLIAPHLPKLHDPALTAALEELR